MGLLTEQGRKQENSGKSPCVLLPCVVGLLADAACSHKPLSAACSDLLLFHPVTGARGKSQANQLFSFLPHLPVLTNFTAWNWKFIPEKRVVEAVTIL